MPFYQKKTARKTDRVGRRSRNPGDLCGFRRSWGSTICGRRSNVYGQWFGEAFTVNGGGINRTFTGSEAVDDAFNAIIGNSVNGKATIHFDNVNITQDNAFPIITQSCELTLTGSYTNLNYAFEFSGDGPFMIHSSANIKANILLDRSGNGQLTFEQTGGTITVGEHGAVLLSDNDTYTLANGTIKGAIGGSGEFVMDNGTLNGYINGPKSITINGGNINTTFGPGAYVYSIYLKEDSELDINGGAIYAKNNSTKDEGGSHLQL